MGCRGIYSVSGRGVGGGRLFRRESLAKSPPSPLIHNGGHKESRIRIAPSSFALAGASVLVGGGLSSQGVIGETDLSH